MYFTVFCSSFLCGENQSFEVRTTHSKGSKHYGHFLRKFYKCKKCKSFSSFSISQHDFLGPRLSLSIFKLKYLPLEKCIFLDSQMLHRKTTQICVKQRNNHLIDFPVFQRQN